jgi:hypothetical protein
MDIINHDKAVEKYAAIVRTYKGKDYSLESDDGKHLESVFYALLEIEEEKLSPAATSLRDSLLEELATKKIDGLV